MAAQRRQRQASWRLSALSGVAVALLGVPLSVLLSPLILVIALLVYDVVGLFHHLSSPFGSLPHKLQTGNSDKVFAELARSPAVLLVLVPGALALVVCWLGVRRIFRKVGGGSDLLAASRPIRAGDLEEHQLANLVEAVAIAAGIPPPAVRIIEVEAPNAGIAGTSFDQATVIATAGLLAQLGRYETEGVVAHLVAAIGAGDLHRARTLETFYATIGLIEAALGMRTVPGARRALGLTLRCAFGRGDPAAAQKALLDVTTVDPVEARKGCLSLLFTPITVTGAAFTFNAQAIGDTLVRSLLRGRWRHRVLLADATSVELTRYPDGLAKALADLGPDPAVIDGAADSVELLVAGPAKGKGLTGFHPPVERRMTQLTRIGSTVDMVGDVRVRSSSRKAKLIIWAILSPLLLVFGVAVLGAIVMSVFATMVITGLYFGIPLAVIHALLVSAGR